jgi:CheY-like chemotaxis protein
MSDNHIFVLALVLIVGILALLFLALRVRIPAKVGLTVGKFISVKVELSADEKNKAVGAAEKAAKARGQSGPEAAEQVRSRVSSLEKVRLTRVLWVDDHPDNNTYESLALLNLGFVITTATSNQAARYCLSESQFDLVITDLGRDSTEDDGTRLIHELHAERPGLPVVVYTGWAGKHRADLVQAGATAVEDTPAALISAVLTVRR